MKTRGGMANGVFGCAVVGIILLASLGMAFLGNADERQVDTTNWDYVTSANPAFSYNQAPARIDYSPPANYTGYTEKVAGSEYTSGITYTSSATPTAYPVKSEPQNIASGEVSFNDLNDNGLVAVGNQNADWSYNKILNRSLDPLNYFSPSSLSFMNNIVTTMAAVTSATFPTHTIITLSSYSDNLYFVINNNNLSSYAGVQNAQSNRYFVFEGPTFDKIIIDADTLAATLYNNGVAVTTASIPDILVGVTTFSGSDNAAALKALELDYKIESWSRDYLNPIYGISPIPASSPAPGLTNAADLDPSAIYSAVDLSGADIVSTFQQPAQAIHLYFKVALGATVNISEYVGSGGSWIYAIEAFNWTATTPGDDFEFNITKNVAGKWEWATILHIEVVDIGRVYWFNGYDNAAVDILIKSFNGTVTIDNTPVACTSAGAWTVGGVSVGKWPAILLTLDMDAGLYVTPVSSFINFESYELINSKVQISDSSFAAMSRLSMITGDAVNLSIVSTTVYVPDGGVYRVDSTLNVAAKFPTYDTYNVTITGAPHYGDSITINGTTCAVDPDAGTVLIGGVNFPLAGLVLAYSDNAFYYNGTAYDAGHLVAINGDLAADLGAVSGLILKFDGTWYYETQLYEGAPGTITVLDWAPGIMGMSPAAISGVFTLLSLVGLVLASRLGGGLYDYLVLGSAALVGFIFCGVYI